MQPQGFFGPAMPPAAAIEGYGFQLAPQEVDRGRQEVDRGRTCLAHRMNL